MLRRILIAGGLLGLFAAPVLGNSFPSAPIYPSFNSPHPHAQLKTLDPPKATDTELDGINASGVIVGSYIAQKTPKIRYALVRSANGTFTKFRGKGAMQTRAVAVNDSGAIAGLYYGSDDITHGFVRAADGTITPFDASGSTATEPTEINSHGSIVGNYYDSEDHSHGFLRDASGNITTIDFTGTEDGTTITCINDKGVIAGYYTDYNFSNHGFIRGVGGKFTSVDVPGASKKSFAGTFVGGINNHGVIYGNFVDAAKKRNHGFVRAADGTFTVFDAEGSTDTYFVSTNAAGAITGYYLANKSTRDGFVRAANGTITTFSAPGAAALGTVPAAINAKSVVVGTYYDEKNNGHGFELAP